MIDKGGIGFLNKRKQIKIRWATWWPVPYWIDRFNTLAEHHNVDLEVVFLSSASELLPSRLDKKNWKFSFHVIRKENAISGYSKINKRIPMPWAIVKGDFDILVMPYADPDYISAAFLCILLKKKFCIFSPNNKYEQRSFSFVREKLKKIIFGKAIGSLTTGIDQKQYAFMYLKSHKNVHIVGNPAPNLIQLKELSGEQGKKKIRKEFKWGNELVLLYVGRFSQEKGVYSFFDSLVDLHNRNIKVRTIFVGTGPCENDLKAKAKASNLNVEFTGFLEGADLTKRYIAVDVFVLPSLSEAWGLVVNEAMEAGLPVIVSDRVGARKTLVQHGVNGLVFQAGNSKNLASKLVYLDNNPEVREDMSKASLSIIKQHTIGAWVENVTKAVCKMTAGNCTRCG